MFNVLKRDGGCFNGLVSTANGILHNKNGSLIGLYENSMVSERDFDITGINGTCMIIQWVFFA